MPSYNYNAVQGVALNQGAILNTAIPCNCGLVLHENGTTFLIMRGVPSRPCSRIARYRVTADCNIAIPDGGTVTPIAVAFAVEGEVRQVSRAIVTPAAAGDYFHVSLDEFIDIPRGCCFNVSIRNVAASEDTGYTPAPIIDMQNLNITVEKVPA